MVEFSLSIYMFKNSFNKILENIFLTANHVTNVRYKICKTFIQQPHFVLAQRHDIKPAINMIHILTSQPTMTSHRRCGNKKRLTSYNRYVSVINGNKTL